MTLQEFVTALDLPGSCRVDQRVPKKLLIENGAMNARDKRQINESIEGIQWLAALKPNSIGVAKYRDDEREYLYIAVLSVTLKDTGEKSMKVGSLVELMHRAIPYPMLLLFQWEQNVMLSLAHKRWAQNEVGKIILDGSIVSVTLLEDAPTASVEIAFMQALALRRQPQATLYTLYQGWMDILYALLAARITGAFNGADSLEQSAIRRQALEDYERLESEVARLRAKAMKEKQLATQVELNLALRLVQTKMADARGRL
jgi:hypothetical protein